MKTVIPLVIVLVFSTIWATDARALITYEDGLTHEINSQVYEDIAVHDGPTDPTTLLVVAGAFTHDLLIFDNSTLVMTGGSIDDGGLALYNSATAEISAFDYIDDLIDLYDSGALTLSGGPSSLTFRLWGDSRLLIDGSNFLIDGNPATAGPLTGPIAEIQADLATGPTHISCIINDNANVILIPEPTTLTLLALSAPLLRRKKP